MIHHISHFVAVMDAGPSTLTIERVFEHKDRRQLLFRVYPEIRAVGAIPGEIPNRSRQRIAAC
jgi:hypothetical protein